MKPDLYNMLFPSSLSIASGIMAIFFLTVGLRGILTKRPFLISQRWLLLIVFVACIPTSILCSLARFPGGSNLMSWLAPLLFGFILLMVWYQTKGYTAYAVTDASFREALVGVLQKLQLPYEESLSLIRFTSVRVDLQVSVQGWLGTGIINVKQRAYHFMLREVVNSMNEYFRMSPVPTNMITCVFFVAAGGLMVIAAIGVLFF